ncbi:hypothetical protein [Yinghuangia seranimata]|uniref:hypothetical protein n=1 Tax=Yinghuangia seranimata TaxID=408067 RepID=UPI00248C0E51|nr:hypothetical protein [Yinghuangia seranimata]MDI2129341.1 hypothetical protein [Yinghuangia seranimata]
MTRPGSRRSYVPAGAVAAAVCLVVAGCGIIDSEDSDLKSLHKRNDQQIRQEVAAMLDAALGGSAHIAELGMHPPPDDSRDFRELVESCRKESDSFNSGKAKRFTAQFISKPLTDAQIDQEIEAIRSRLPAVGFTVIRPLETDIPYTNRAAIKVIGRKGEKDTDNQHVWAQPTTRAVTPGTDVVARHLAVFVSPACYREAES